MAVIDFAWAQIGEPAAQVIDFSWAQIEEPAAQVIDFSWAQLQDTPIPPNLLGDVTLGPKVFSSTLRGSLGVLGSDIPVGSCLDLPGKSPTVRYRAEVTRWPTGGTFVLLEDGSFSYTGPQDYFDYQLIEDGIANTTDVGFGPGIVRVMLLVGISGFIEGDVTLGSKVIGGVLQSASELSGGLTLSLKDISGTFSTGTNFGGGLTLALKDISGLLLSGANLSGGVTLALKDVSGILNFGDNFSGDLLLSLKWVVGVLGTSSSGRIMKVEIVGEQGLPQYFEASSMWLTVTTKDINEALVLPAIIQYRILCVTNQLEIRPLSLLPAMSQFELEITAEENRLLNRGNIRELRRLILTVEFGVGDKRQQKYDYWVLNIEKTA